jgi:hypothetical protein
MRLDQGAAPKIRLACVKPDGSRHGESRTLSATLERIDSVYSYRRQSNGWETWDCERIRKVVAPAAKIVVPAGRTPRSRFPPASAATTR